MSSPSFIQPRYAAGASVAFGTFVGLHSIYTLVKPKGALALLGFRQAVSPTDQTLTEGILRMFAATRAAGAVVQLAAWYYGDYKILGWQMAAGSIMALVDGWVSETVSGTGGWGHWSFIPVSLGIGLTLILG